MTDIHIPRMPDKILEQLVGVLLLHHQPRRLDDIAGILDKFAAIRGKLIDIHWGCILNISERLVDLFIIGHATLPEGLDHAVKTNLAGELVSTAAARFKETRRTLRSTSASLSALTTGSTTEP